MSRGSFFGLASGACLAGLGLGGCAGLGTSDFFVYSMSGSDDFACSAIRSQIESMLEEGSDVFREAASLSDGNVAFRVREGYSHDGDAANEYSYNGMRLFFNGPRLAGSAGTGEPCAWHTADTAPYAKEASTTFMSM